jgi:hypothetical protein
LQEGGLVGGKKLHPVTPSALIAAPTWVNLKRGCCCVRSVIVIVYLLYLSHLRIQGPRLTSFGYKRKKIGAKKFLKNKKEADLACRK